MPTVYDDDDSGDEGYGEEGYGDEVSGEFMDGKVKIAGVKEGKARAAAKAKAEGKPVKPANHKKDQKAHKVDIVASIKRIVEEEVKKAQNHGKKDHEKKDHGKKKHPKPHHYNPTVLSNQNFDDLVMYLSMATKGMSQDVNFKRKYHASQICMDAEAMARFKEKHSKENLIKAFKVAFSKGVNNGVYSLHFDEAHSAIRHIKSKTDYAVSFDPKFGTENVVIKMKDSTKNKEVKDHISGLRAHFKTQHEKEEDKEKLSEARRKLREDIDEYVEKMKKPVNVTKEYARITVSVGGK